MGLAERREREKKQLKRMILKTAMDLFIADGYERVSIRRIADKIEYSPGTIYLYFKDKDDIFYQLQEEAFDEYHKFQRKVGEIADPLDRLIKLGENYLTFAMNNPEHYELMFILKAPMRKIEEPAEWSGGMRAFNQLRDIVAEGMEKGRIRGENVDVVTMTMWTNVHGMASLIIRDRLSMMPEEALVPMISGMLNYIKNIVAEKK
jgi:AcrR family transcriptional regulator